MSGLTPFRVQGCALILLLTLIASAVGQSETNRPPAARAQREFSRAQTNFLAQPAVATNAWRLARTSYDWAEFATNDTQRADIARAGIDACRQLLARDPNSAPGHYYLAMDYGQLAQAESPSVAAYKLVKEIESEFSRAAELDDKFDFAGPVRCLGLLYRDAPSWPLSVGNKRKAREFLERAVALAPNYPENQLNLAESQFRWHELDAAEKTLHALNVIWPAARTNLGGEAWQRDWDDWTARRTALKAELEKTGNRAP